ncbi:MAG: DUF3857 domain-containing protein [Candidatus Cloacimonetes bacterium]|nr:DUF3857 domain-containing protein [Candidatus Cloacimonadota bacterium]
MRKTSIAILVLTIFLIGCAQTVDYTFLQNFNRENYPDTDAIIVEDSTHIDLQENGKYVSTNYKLIKILSMKGKAQFSEASFGYFTKYDTIVVEEARMINPDGSIIEVKNENIKDVKIPAFGKFFLPNVRMKKISFPNIKEGSSIEYKIKDIVSNAPKDNSFNVAEMFESDNPIENKVFEIKAKMDLDWKIENNDKIVESIIRDRGNHKLYKWKAENVQPYKSEPMMPPVQNVLAKLVVSSVDSWKEWSRWYYELCEDKISTTPEIDALVDSLLKNEKTRMDSIKSLYYWVSKNIRYVGTKMSGKKGGYEPFPAAETYEKKYGVCRDKAALLAAMLREAGFEAHVVLINPILNIKPDISHICEFNHAITAVKNENDSYLYIDGTAENTSELLMSIEQDKAVLIATPEGEELLYTPKLPAKDSQLSIVAKGKLNAENQLQEKVVMKATGLMGMAFRQILTKFSTEQRKMVFNRIITSMSNQAKLDTFYYSDPEDLRKIMEITFIMSADDYGLMLGDEFSFKLPLAGGGGSAMSTTMGSGQNPFSLEERQYPLYFYSTMQTRINETLHLPQNYKVKNLPDSFTKGTENFFVEKTYKSENGTIKHTMINSFEDYSFNSEEYKKMKEVIDKLSEISEQEIILEKMGDK